MPRRRAAIGLMAFCLSVALAGPGVRGRAGAARHACRLRHASAWARRARVPACQAGEAALRRRARARPETARRRHPAAGDPRQGVARQRRRRLLHRELLGGEDTRRGAVRGLPLRPRRQGLCRVVLRRQWPEALSGDVRPGRHERARHPLRLWRRRSLRLVRQGDSQARGHQGLAHAQLRPWRQGHVAARRHDRARSRRQDRRGLRQASRSTAPSSSPPPSISASVSRITPRSSMCLAGTSPRPCSSC